MSRHAQRIGLECRGSIKRALERRRYIAKRLPMTGDDRAYVEAREHLQRRARGRQRARMDLQRHDQTVAVAPQRVSRDQNPVLGIVENQRSHIVTRRGERAPFQIAPDERFSRLDDFVVVKSLRALVAVAEQKRLLVPRVDQRRLAFRQYDRTAIARLDGRVAAHVVAVAVSVDELGERRTGEPLRRCE